MLAILVFAALISQAPPDQAPAPKLAPAARPAPKAEKPKERAPATKGDKASPKTPSYTVETMRGDVPASTLGRKG